jgi:hypothetical protein
MQSSTIRISIGSLSPDSASSVRATRRRSVEPRSTAKIAAASVEATIPPRSRLRSHEKSNRRWAAAPTTPAVIAVPTIASRNAGPSTGPTSANPAESPPSNRISARAAIPMRRASS